MADFTQVWQQICMEALADDNFKDRLMSRPNDVLKEHGFEAPPNFKFKVVANEPAVMHLVLPAKQEDIDSVAPAGDSTISQYNASIV